MLYGLYTILWSDFFMEVRLIDYFTLCYISEVQPLTESPDICIYSVVNKVQNAPPKAKPSSASNMESTQSASPQALSKTSNPKTGHTSTYQHVCTRFTNAIC